MPNLNPKLWLNDKLLPAVREHLLATASKFFEFLKLKQPFEDVILTGSSANFNWTSKSDIDLHLLFDYPKINENTDLVKEYMWAHKVAWNDEHEISIRKIPIELYAQDINEAHYSTGVYSVLKDKWIKHPVVTEKHDVDKKAIEHKAQPLEYEIDQAVEAGNYDKLVKIVDKLKTMRSSGLEKGGEYSIENLTFKYLRNNGYLEKLTDARDKALDEQLTLEHQMSITKRRIITAVLKEAASSSGVGWWIDPNGKIYQIPKNSSHSDWMQKQNLFNVQSDKQIEEAVKNRWTRVAIFADQMIIISDDIDNLDYVDEILMKEKNVKHINIKKAFEHLQLDRDEFEQNDFSLKKAIEAIGVMA